MEAKHEIKYKLLIFITFIEILCAQNNQNQSVEGYSPPWERIMYPRGRKYKETMKKERKGKTLRVTWAQKSDFQVAMLFHEKIPSTIRG